MKHRPTPDQISAAAEGLIKLAGSKRAAYRAIKIAKTKSKGGRPKGSPYFAADARMLFEVESLQNEYRHLRRPEPKKRTLIAEIVPEDAARRGLGQSKDAVVARLASRPGLAGLIFEAIRQHRPDLLKQLPEDAEARIQSLEDDPSKANFAAVLTPLLILWAFQQRHPQRFARIAARAAKGKPKGN
jgi:hypothetical protein